MDLCIGSIIHSSFMSAFPFRRQTLQPNDAAAIFSLCCFQFSLEPLFSI